MPRLLQVGLVERRQVPRILGQAGSQVPSALHGIHRIRVDVCMHVYIYIYIYIIYIYVYACCSCDVLAVALHGTASWAFLVAMHNKASLVVQLYSRSA